MLVMHREICLEKKKEFDTNTLSYQSSLKAKSCTQDSEPSLDAASVLSGTENCTIFQNASISSVLGGYFIVRKSR